MGKGKHRFKHYQHVVEKGKLPSHTEGFLFALQEQEIDAKALRWQRRETRM